MNETRWNLVKEKIRTLVSDYKSVKSENDLLKHQLQQKVLLITELQNKRELPILDESSDLEIIALKEQLLKKELLINDLESENERALSEIRRLEEAHQIKDSTLQVQKNTINDLTEQNKMIKLAKEMSIGKTDTHELKIKINELIRDIDRCIDLLND
jgi:hypothetical protein